MIANLRPYPAYKDSRVEWLGKVPKHWGVQRLGTVLRERGEQNQDGSISDVLSVLRNRGVIPYSQKGNIGNKKSDDITRYKIVRPFDIVVNSMNVIIGSVGLSRYTGCLSPVYYVLTRRSDSDNPQYLSAYFQAKPFQKSLVRIGNGILAHRMRIPMERLKCEPFPKPPRAEQDAIVRFLGYANRRVRRYIRAKERLIELLEEQKQAIIHQAVTGQIDVLTGQPYPGYKNSGVEWLGNVPEHWKVSRLGRLMKLAVGFPFKSEGFTQSDDDIRLLRGVNIAPGRLRWDSVVRWPVEDADSFAEYRMQVGDIVLGMDRPIIQGGTRVAVVSESDVPSLLLQRVARVRVGESLIRDFAMALLGGKGFSDYLAPIFTGISVPHLSPEQIKGFQFALPNVVEQKAINQYVKSTTYAFQSGIVATLTQIQLLEEYRTRLIADVVTGKLDVHEAEASLPEVDPLGSDDTRRKPEATPAANPGASDPAFQQARP